MRGWQVVMQHSLWASVGAMALLVAGCAGAGKAPATLSGSQEVPAVTTNASGVTDIYVHSMKCPAPTSGSNCFHPIGSVSVAGMTPTAVHVHQAAAGQNGPVIVPLTRVSDTLWVVPAGANINRDQYEAWWNGQTYVNVHSAANPGGEIRAQLKP